MATRKKTVKASGTKKPSRRTKKVVAKVSPLRGMPIDEFIAKKLDGWQSGTARRIVEVVRKAAPSASVSIKWGQPVFEDNGPFLFIEPAKAHLSVGFWRGAELGDPKNLLEVGNRMGHFKLKDPADLDEKALAALVKEAVQLNRRRGSPTLRG